MGSSQSIKICDSFPEDGVSLEKSFKEKPWNHKIFANDLAAIRQTEDGISSLKPVTVAQAFKLAAQKWKDKPALAYEEQYAGKTSFADGIDVDTDVSQPREQWKTWTWGEYYETCKQLGRANLALGLQENQGIAIWGFNSPYWMMASVGGMLSGGISMGIYPTDNPEIVAYKIKHCNSIVAFVESAYHQKVVERLFAEGQLEVGVTQKFTRLKAIVVWDGPGPQGVPELPVYSFNDYLKLGDDTADYVLEKAMAQHPGKVVNYCYTSGTTGMPKAVMCSNDNLTWSGRTIIYTGWSNGIKEIPEQVRIVSYLPLSHIAATMTDMMVPIVSSAGLNVLPEHQNSYSTMYFVRPYDLKLGSLKHRLAAIKPVIFLAVPRVWEKIEFTIKSMAKTGLIGSIIGFLKDRNLQNSKNMQLGGDGSEVWGTGMGNVIANGIKAKLGLDECLFCLTGASPIRKETLEYFASLGIQIYEAYGMSETSGVSTLNKIGASQWGCIGGKLDGVDVGIFDMKNNPITEQYKAGETIPESAQGEIRVRGRNIMMGYLANPDLGEEHVATIRKKNEETILRSGWLCTGDKGAKNTQNMFKISGRFKELIITAGGENVPPVPIEENVKVLCNAVSNIMMYGDDRPYNTALVTLRTVGYTGESPGSNELDPAVLALMKNPDVRTVQDVLSKDESHPVIQSIIQAIAATNANGSVCPSNACKIQRFTILPQDFSVEGTELTSTLKLKRSVVSKLYADAIENIYNAPREAKYVRIPGAVKAKL